jgi:hypothetical protein
MISVLASIAVDHMFEHLLGQPTIYDIGTCCFSGNDDVRIVLDQHATWNNSSRVNKSLHSDTLYW